MTKQERARLIMTLAVQTHRLNYEWMPPDPRQDGKSLRPWDSEPKNTNQDQDR
jgi:hypothetical protein